MKSNISFRKGEFVSRIVGRKPEIPVYLSTCKPQARTRYGRYSASDWRRVVFINPKRTHDHGSNRQKAEFRVGAICPRTPSTHQNFGTGVIRKRINHSSFNLLLLTSASGAVYKALDKDSGNIVAVKVVEIQADKSNTTAVMQEIKILQVHVSFRVTLLTFNPRRIAKARSLQPITQHIFTIRQFGYGVFSAHSTYPNPH